MQAIKAEMFLFNVVLFATLAIVGSTNAETSTPSSGSEKDQYPKRKGTGVLGQPPFGMAISQSEDATDRTKQVGPNGVLMRVFTSTLSKDGVNPSQEASSILNDHRSKRSYYPYYPGYQIQLPQFDSLNTWRPNLYPIQRPYFVPIYGYDGRIPIYYPQFTYYHNAGFPPHNPGKPPYVGPTYLPPVTTAAPPTEKNDTTMMPIDNRFGDNDDDERPVWDNNGAYYPDRRTSPRPPMAPTRKPISGTTTLPPLVHKDSDSPKSTNVIPNENENKITPVPASIPRPQGPSKCVWAIVSCCSTSSRDVSYECFDQLGCGGPFWDVNPCDTEYAKAAIETALNYYNMRF